MEERYTDYSGYKMKFRINIKYVMNITLVPEFIEGTGDDWKKYLYRIFLLLIPRCLQGLCSVISGLQPQTP